MGLAYLLPLSGLPVVGVLVAILAGYLLALAIGGSVIRGVPVAFRRSRARRLRRAWADALEGAEPPPGSPQATSRSVSMVGAGWGRPLAGGPVWVNDCNMDFKESLAWALAASDDVNDAAGEWVATADGFCVTMPSSGGVIWLRWEDVRTLTVLRPVRVTSRSVYLATHDGRTAQLAIDPSAATHLHSIKELIGVSRTGRAARHVSQSDRWRR